MDIAHGRIFRVSPSGDWDVVVQYDGQPNGLKIHRDGRVFIADFVRGIMELDPANGRVEPFLDRERFPDFKGFNDLFFASNGDLYFTDQGLTGLHDPSGRVWRHRAADGRLECLIDTVPSPNGLVMARDESLLYIAVTRANAVWRMPFDTKGRPFKVGLFVQLQGGAGGPDGMAMDAEGNLSVVQHGAGKVWLLSPTEEPVACIGRPHRTRGHQPRLRRAGEPDPLHHRVRYRPSPHRGDGRAGGADVLAPRRAVAERREPRRGTSRIGRGCGQGGTRRRRPSAPSSNLSRRVGMVTYSPFRQPSSKLS